MRQIIFRRFPILLGLLFIYSGTEKLFHPAQPMYALMALNVRITPSIANVTILALTSLELYLGLILALRIDLKWSLGAATVLLVLFTGFLWYLLTLAHPPACGCLGLTGMFKSAKNAALFGIVRNCVLLWLIKWCYEAYFTEPTAHAQDLHPDLAAGISGQTD